MKDYDYSQKGLYFTTICSHNKECIFGEVIVEAHCMCPNSKVILNEYGKIVENELLKTKEIRKSDLYFGIQGFNGEGLFNGQLFIGTFNKKAPDKSSYADVEGNESFSNWWINVRQFENNGNYILNMSNPETITYIMNEKNREGLVDYMMKQVEQYLKEQTPPLVDFILKNKIV